jgi:ferritin-like metal-binding protein YciE
MHIKTFVDWLNEAHAMEVELISVLQAHRDQADGYEDVQEKIAQHLEETKRQADRLRVVIEGMGEHVAETKSAVSQVVGAFKAGVDALPEDRLIRNAIAEYATEHYEMACYQKLIAAAKELGHQEIVKTLQTSFDEEKKTADAIYGRLPVLTVQYLKELKDKE